MGLLEKFGGEQGEDHPDRLTWPGSEAGFPLLGRPAPNVKQREHEEETDHKLVYREKLFRTWIDDDMREYRYVRERAANGWFQVMVCERHWDQERKGNWIWLEWVQIYAILPKDLMQRDAVRDYVQRTDDVDSVLVPLNPVDPDNWQPIDPREGFDPFTKGRDNGQ